MDDGGGVVIGVKELCDQGDNGKQRSGACFSPDCVKLTACNVGDLEHHRKSAEAALDTLIVAVARSANVVAGDVSERSVVRMRGRLYGCLSEEEVYADR